MLLKSLLAFSCVLLLTADKLDAKLVNRQRDPQIVSTSNFTRLKPQSQFEVSDKYKPNWESLDSRPLPKWYDEAKVGKLNRMKLSEKRFKK